MMLVKANFIAFLKHIDLPTLKTQMTFGVSRDAGDFEWAGTSLSGVFAQRGNLFKPRMWRLLFDIVRFNQFALDLLEDEENDNDPIRDSNNGTNPHPREESIGEYLNREGYSQTFRDDYLIPMTAAVWSTSPDKASLHFPAITLVRFMWNHHLLTTVAARPDWMTISGGSQLYIDAVMKDFPRDRVHLRTKVTALRPRKDGHVTLCTENWEEDFDHVILATHGDQALEIMDQAATTEERKILSGFKTNKNVAILHSDLSFMPKRRVAWSAWNYITESPFPPSIHTKNVSKVCLTYWMNLLQHIPEKQFGDVLVTLNPLFPPDPRLVQGIWEYSHPLYNAEAIKSQALLPRIQNRRGISYCGAWTKYGFHEDGFSSGLASAIDHLGAKLPFQFIDSTFSRGRKPVLTWQDQLVRIIVELIHVIILLMDAIVGRAWNTLDERVTASHKKQ
jgi:predicted NAD/FAD-binding protein